MLRHRMLFVILTAVLVLSTLLMVSAKQVLRLTQNQARQPASEYQLAVRRTKQLVDTGKCGAARKAFDDLKREYPEMAGSDFDAFVKVEMLRCSGELTKAAMSYDKFLAKYSQSELYEAALQRRFHIGQEFLAGRKKKVLGIIPMSGHTEGVSIMDAITFREGVDEPNGIGVRAAKAVAESYQKKGASDAVYYDLAYFTWLYLYEESRIGQQLNKEALLGMARSKYAMYRGPQYDASCLANVERTGAKDYYEKFKSRYPKDANDITVDKILEKLNDELAQKQLSIGRYYQKTGNIRAANLYYQMAMDKWPNSPAAQEANKMLVKNLGMQEATK